MKVKCYKCDHEYEGTIKDDCPSCGKCQTSPVSGKPMLWANNFTSNGEYNGKKCMNKEPIWLEQIQDGCRDIRKISCYLDHLAGCFRQTGQNQFAEKLVYYSNRLDNGLKQIDSGANKCLTETINRS